MTSGTRRQFLQLSAARVAGTYLATRFGSGRAALARGHDAILRADRIPKFVTPLFVPPPMPPAARDATTDAYIIAVRQFRQRILPPPLPATLVWGYGSVSDAATFSYPAFTIEARAHRRVRVTATTGLVMQFAPRERVFAEAQGQRCWNHRLLNVPDKP